MGRYLNPAMKSDIWYDYSALHRYVWKYSLTLTFLCFLKESLEDFVFCETGWWLCPSYVPGQYRPEPPSGSSVQLQHLSQPAVPAHQGDWPATQLQKCFLSLFHFQSGSCSFSQNSTVDSQNMGEINRFLF